jgi:hypothetical protein
MHGEPDLEGGKKQAAVTFVSNSEGTTALHEQANRERSYSTNSKNKFKLEVKNLIKISFKF